MKGSIYLKLTITISCFILLSCSGIKSIKKEFKYCYNGENSGLDSIINIHGYYSMGIIYDKYNIGNCHTHIIDTIYINFMFFKDGILVYNFFDNGLDNPAYLKKVVENSKKGKSDSFYKYFRWGRYVIDGNIIKTQLISIPRGLNDSQWTIGETCFKIINQQTLSEIRQEESLESNKYKYLPAKFVYVETIPSSNCKLKEKKWFWCSGVKNE